MTEGKLTRRDLLRRGGAVVAAGALGGLAAWLIGGRSEDCREPEACAGCRHLASCRKAVAERHRREVRHGR